MKDKRKYVDQLAMRTQLPGEVLPGRTLVEIVGNDRVLIEYHKGLICYGCNTIIVKTTDGRLVICGCNLMVSSMSTYQMVISGTIEGVNVVKERNG